MKNWLFPRMITALLCLCLFPPVVQADSSTYIPPDSQAIHSKMSLRLGLHADGFPRNASKLKAWEDFLQKLSLKGTLNTIDFGQPMSRVYFNGGLYMNDVIRIPFVYDGYHSYRYLISPAVYNESIHFQMHNFFQFMLKPYYYMELPTPYIALLLYPEAAHYVWDSYYGSLQGALDTKETQTIPYETLRALCQQMNLYVTDDAYYDRMTFFFTSLLADIGLAESALNFLSSLEDYLDDLDPGKKGLTVAVEDGHRAYVLGGRTIYEETSGENGSFSLILTLPGKEGQELHCAYRWEPSKSDALLLAELKMIADGKSLLSLRVDGSGLPQEGDLLGEGRVSLAFAGHVTEEQFPPLIFDFHWGKTRGELPYHFSLDMDWLHPTTGIPALSLHYNAAMGKADPGIFVEGAYPQEDFFSLNEGSMAEYQKRYMLPLVLALAPVMLEMPAGVLEDVIQFAVNTGIWESMGIPAIMESPGVMNVLEILGITALFKELGVNQAGD